MHSDDLNGDSVKGPLCADWKEVNKPETAPELPQGPPIHVDSGGEPSDSQCRNVDLFTENFAVSAQATEPATCAATAVTSYFIWWLPQQNTTRTT